MFVSSPLLPLSCHFTGSVSCPTGHHIITLNKAPQLLGGLLSIGFHIFHAKSFSDLPALLLVLLRMPFHMPFKAGLVAAMPSPVVSIAIDPFSKILRVRTCITEF